MDKPKIYVVIPWKHQNSRLRAYEMVKDWYEKNLPEATVVSLTYSEVNWLPSHTRNLGVRLAEGNRADIVILNDADTIPDGVETLRKTINAAMSDNFIHNPYHEYRFYNLENTNKYFNGTPFIHCQFRIEHGSNAGIWVFKPSSWWLLGGMDEKFEKWGYEDTAFEYVHKLVHGIPLVKHTGYIHAFDHDREQTVEKPDQNLIDNFNIYKQYLTITNADDMLKFVRSR
jgi:hypothetical protein